MMKLSIQGITEEEYGLWINGGVTEKIPDKIDDATVIMTKIGFFLEDVKNFQLDLNHNNHMICVKVHNDKTYDVYREHLITLIKMMILNRKPYKISIYIVSDKNEDYKNELTNFFNLNTHYEKNKRYGQYLSIIKCLSMRFIGFSLTNTVIKINTLFFSVFKKDSK